MATDEEALDLNARDAEVESEDSIDEPKSLAWWSRAILVGLTAPWIAVFITGFFLNPYAGDDGEPRRMGTHMQLGLPDCNFKVITTVPCPSCGMTTSFAYVMHADFWNSLQANFAGTALATFGLLFLPWAIASAFLGKFLFIRSLEMVVFRLAIIFLIILFGRWAIVIAIDLLERL
jgi:uncharacterized protein DUF2752